MKKSIIVLMSTYNGEKYIVEQIESIFKQVLEDIDLTIYVRDDGSVDSTVEILEKYQQIYPNQFFWYQGENLGPTKSFWDLLYKAPNADYYAFCDQDDFWFEDKIQRAISCLEQKQNIPLLYCSNYIPTDKNLNPLNLPADREKYFTDFAHSLIYTTAPGCTFVFNRLAMIEFRKYDERKYGKGTIHDWLAHRIVLMKGEMVYDNKPSMYYRQHGGNAIGVQEKSIRELWNRIIRCFITNKCQRSDSAASLLNVFGEELDDEKKTLLNMIANYRFDTKLKRALLKDDRFLIGSKKDNLFKMLVLLNKI